MPPYYGFGLLVIVIVIIAEVQVEEGKLSA